MNYTGNQKADLGRTDTCLRILAKQKGIERFVVGRLRPRVVILAPLYLAQALYNFEPKNTENNLFTVNKASTFYFPVTSPGTTKNRGNKMYRPKNSYSGDPYWLTARYNGKCKCGAPVKKGDNIFYYPKGKVVCGSSCGCADVAAQDFADCCEVEDFYGHSMDTGCWEPNEYY